MKNFDLEKLRLDTGVDSVLVFTTEGELIQAHKVAFDVNIAAMTGIIFKMCNDLSEDLFSENTQKLMVKCNSGMFVASRISATTILGFITKETTKLGILLKHLDTIYFTE